MDQHQKRSSSHRRRKNGKDVRKWRRRRKKEKSFLQSRMQSAVTLKVSEQIVLVLNTSRNWRLKKQVGIIATSVAVSPHRITINRFIYKSPSLYTVRTNILSPLTSDLLPFNFLFPLLHVSWMCHVLLRVSHPTSEHGGDRGISRPQEKTEN